MAARRKSTLLARIGEGGMGVVHLARRPGGQRVALKVLRPHVVGDEEARQRLAREVDSLGRVTSPRIAEILDADPWGDVPYVATRYVPGLSLHDHVKSEGPLTGDDLRWFALCLAEALAAVHAVGVLHRDVKPSNVLMEGRSPVLIDFGLAMLAEDSRLTRTGFLLGTPGYLAPEILHGDDATPASDLHSWAATVAYAGTGRGPFGRGPAMAVMDRVRRGEHDLDGLGEEMAKIVHACLDPDPARRPDLALVLRWLAPSGPSANPVPEPDSEPHTMPYAVASLGGADDSTRVDRTLVDDEDEAPTAHLRPRHEPYQQPPPPRAAEPWAIRIRRTTLVLLAAGVAGATTAAFPYLALILLVGFGWVLRSVSLAGSAAGDLRRLRGPKWYDGPRALLASPWHFVRSIPGTFVLLCWAAGLALAGGLLCYAFGVDLTTSLFVNGTLFAVAMWVGPGGSRIRRPVRRLVDPISAHLGAWLVTVALVGGAAVAIGVAAVGNGPDWQPAYSEPLMPGTFLGDLLRR